VNDIILKKWILYPDFFKFLKRDVKEHAIGGGVGRDGGASGRQPSGRHSSTPGAHLDPLQTGPLGLSSRRLMLWSI